MELMLFQGLLSQWGWTDMESTPEISFCSDPDELPTSYLRPGDRWSWTLQSHPPLAHRNGARPGAQTGEIMTWSVWVPRAPLPPGHIRATLESLESEAVGTKSHINKP